MPLVVRYVEPKHLCRRPLPEGTRNELHAVAVLSLAGAIRQISSVAKHAESLMGEICDQLTEYNRRSTSLHERVARLKRKVSRLDQNRQSERQLEEALSDTPFQSARHITQQLLSIKTAPESLIEQYENSDRPPPLGCFTTHWLDGRDAMKLYSNPRFFFDSWREEMMKKESTKRHSGVQNSKIEEGAGEATKPSNSSNYSTMPTRSKGQEKKLEVLHKFNSIRTKSKKQRKAINEDTFVNNNVSNGGSQEYSVSSGYMSQYSSFNSLADHTDRHTPIFTSTSSIPTTLPVENHTSATTPKMATDELDTPTPTATESTKLKVLTHRKSSILSEKSNGNGRSHKKGVALENGSVSPCSERELTPPISKYSPRKESLPTHFQSTNNILLTDYDRKPSLPVKLTPPFVSPTVSPEINRRVMSISRSFSQSSPLKTPVENVFKFPYQQISPLKTPRETFNFPDPLEVSKQQQPLPTLSDFPPIDAEQLLQLQQQHSPNAPRRPAPSLPTGSPRRCQTIDYCGHSPQQPVKSQSSSGENSPRHTSSKPLVSSPNVPRRRAPPPPVAGSESKNLGENNSLSNGVNMSASSTIVEDAVVGEIMKHHAPLIEDLQKQLSHETEDNYQISPKAIKRASKDLQLYYQEENQISPRLINKRASKDLQKQLSQEENNPKATKRASKDLQKQLSQEENQVSPKSLKRSSKELQKQFSQEEKVLGKLIKRTSKELNKKTANQILQSSGVDTALTTERTQLLSAIRHGIQLKKVKQKQREQNKKDEAMPWDVAAILERGEKLKNSDNEHEDDTTVHDTEWEDI